MDNTTGSSLHALKTCGTSQKKIVSISGAVDAILNRAPSSGSQWRSAKVSEENEDRPAKRISLSKERVTGQGSGAVLIPNGVHAASGKRIVLPKEQVTLQGTTRADLKPNEVRPLCRVLFPADTNQAKVFGHHQQQGSPTKQHPLDVPARELIWKGNFKILNCPSYLEECQGIIAHPSAVVAYKAYSFAKQMPSNLYFSMDYQRPAYEAIFKTFVPSRGNIALYFYPGHYESSRSQYSMMLKFIEREGLLLRSRMGDVELLVFPSKLLEDGSQKLGGSYFMWGIFYHYKKGGTSANNAAAAITSSMAKEDSSTSASIHGGTSAIAEGGNFTI